jgi:hypothetical protein
MTSPTSSPMTSVVLDQVRARIVAHPWKALAGAAIVGAWIALEEQPTRRRELRRLAAAALRIVALRAAQRWL